MVILRNFYIVLAVLLFTFAPARAQTSEELANLTQQVVSLYQAGKYAEAILIAQKALELEEQKFGPNHPHVSTALSNLADLYFYQGRHTEAEPLYKRSLSIHEKSLGPEHPNVGIALNNLAFLYSNRGRYAEAEQLYKRSLSISEKALGPDYPNVVIALNGLAFLYRTQARYAEAEPLYKRSLSISKKASGPDHPGVGRALGSLADLYRIQGRYAEAEPLYKSTVTIVKKALGPEHPDVGIALSNLADLYEGQGRYAEAEKLYKHSITIVEKALGPEDLNVSIALNSLAFLYFHRGRYAEAEQLYKRTLTIVEKASGPDHPGVGNPLNNLANLYRAQGRHAEAGALYQRILSIDVKALSKDLGPEHPDVGTALNNLAILYRYHGREDKAKELQPLIDRIPAPGTRHIAVYFATNRQLQNHHNHLSTIAFGNKDGDQLTLERVVVIFGKGAVLARARRIGQGHGRPDRARADLTDASDLQIKQFQRFQSPAQLTRTAKADLSHATRFPRKVLVFVHGYNVGFEDALKRAAQIAFDLHYDGALFAFAWPSKRAWYRYLSDTDSADLAVDHLINLTDTLRQGMPGTKINFIAHSMGNLVLLRALERISERGDNAARKAFGEVILAHADVDAARCRQLVRNAKDSVSGITLYTNANDWALWASGKIRGRSRCGGPTQVYDGVDTIETTGLGETSGFRAFIKRSYNHNVFATNAVLFGEISRLIISGQRPPHQRTSELAQVKNKEGKVYWRYDPNRNIAAQNSRKSK